MPPTSSVRALSLARSLKIKGKIPLALISSIVAAATLQSPMMNTFPAHQFLPISFPLVFLFFMPASASSSASAREVNQPYNDCSPFRFQCGKVQQFISYPFWTKDYPEYCSYEKKFEIKCNQADNSSEIVIQSHKYHVEEINYENQTVTIIDKDYFDHNKDNSCLRPSRNTTLDFKLFGYYFERDPNEGDRFEGDGMLLFLYNCSNLVEDHPNPFNIKPLKCLSVSNQSSGKAFYTSRWSVEEEEESMGWGGCQVIKIPILKRNEKRLLSNPDDWNDVLGEGFEVKWSGIDPDHRCWDCVQSNGHCGYNGDYPINPACYCKGKQHLYMCPSSGADKSKRKKLILGTTSGVGIFLLTCFLVFIICLGRKLPSDKFFWRKKTHDSRNVEAFLENYGSVVPKRYRYSELKKMTNSFKDNLGQGGYGSVFKGKRDDGRLVAVKVLNNSKGGNGEEFINEVASIGRTYHVNVVALLGFCSEGSKRALVYEFMPKGSLEKFIYLDKLGVRHALDCQKLFQIAVGIARGLEYLHRGCNTRIVHFDIKPHNILLDDDFCPKISDFGLAKLCPQQQSTMSMLDARGTIGYTAPEVYCRNIGGVSHKSDVYNYGMMVLEMIGGRKNIDAKAENTSEIYFPHWVYKHIELKESLGLLGFRTETEEDIGRKMVLVGLWCIQTDPTNRPSMTRVLEMLEGSLGNLEMPPKPYLSSPPRSCSSTT